MGETQSPTVGLSSTARMLLGFPLSLCGTSIDQFRDISFAKQAAVLLAKLARANTAASDSQSLPILITEAYAAKTLAEKDPNKYGDQLPLLASAIKEAESMMIIQNGWAKKFSERTPGFIQELISIMQQLLRQDVSFSNVPGLDKTKNALFNAIKNLLEEFGKVHKGIQEVTSRLAEQTRVLKSLFPADKLEELGKRAAPLSDIPIPR